MAIWKLSIKPDAKAGHKPFEYCQKHSLIAVGWSHVFYNYGATTKEESYQKLREHEKGVPRSVERLLEEIKTGDFIWLHQGGAFYLCKVRDNLPIVGTQIGEGYANYDLGHARNADWVRVNDFLVSGRVQRSTIVSRTIQRIYVSRQQEAFFGYLHQCLSKDPDWFPQIDEQQVARFISTVKLNELGDWLTPDDHEDLVAAYLQSQGWTILRSTFFKNKPVFEFVVVRPGPIYGRVQVKSGCVQLPPTYYSDWIRDNEQVLLFSTHPDPYPGPTVPGVLCIDPKAVMSWAAENVWVLSLGLKSQIQCLIEGVR